MQISGNQNIASTLTEMARKNPNGLAVVVQKSPIWGDSHKYVNYSYGELKAKSDAAVHNLLKLGIEPAMHCAVMINPGIEYLAVMFALFQIGAVPVLVDPGIGHKNLKSCLEQSRPEAFIAIAKAHVASRLLGWSRGTLRIYIPVTPNLFELPEQALPIETIDQDIDMTAAIVFTSGSTGIPKGVVYTQRMFLDQIKCLKEIYNLEPKEFDITTFPPFALFYPAMGITTLFPDMDATAPGKVRPERIVHAIVSKNATNMFGSPALLKRVASYCQRHGIKLPTLRRIVSAGAPATLNTLNKLTDSLNESVQIFTPYGATEALPVSSIGSREILDETEHLTQLGAGICIGKPTPGVDVKIIRISDEPIQKWSDDLILPSGETGEIVVRGDRVSRLYYNRADETARAKISLSNDGFYHRMGDLGYYDDQGRLWFCGRKTHRVVAFSKTLFTICCERIFDTHPDVERSALVGIREPGAQMPVLCVELIKGRRDSKRIKNELQALSDSYEMLKPITTFLFHPSFPVDVRHNSKIFREVLAVWAHQKLSEGNL